MKNLKNKCRRGLALILSLVMCLGMLTVPAFATEEEVPEGADQTVACTKDDTCTAETHEEGCPKYEASGILDEEQELAETFADEPEEESNEDPICICEIRCADKANTECEVCKEDPSACTSSIIAGTWFKMDWELDLEKETLTYTANPANTDEKYNPDWAYTPAGVIKELQPYREQIKNVVIESGITKISQNSFQGLASLESVEIPNTVTEIAYAAFVDCCSLKSVEIPDSVTKINNGFVRCTGLETVKLPDSMENIPTFAGCTALSKINIPAKATAIPSNVFANCTSLTKIDIPETITSIGSDAFSKSGLESIEIPDSVTEIGERAFSNCKNLSQVKLPKNENFASIPLAAFEYCASLESIDIPANVTYLGKYAFGCSGLKSLFIPKTVTSMGGLTFLACYDLESVEIEEGITSLDGGAFYACGNLTSVKLPSTLTEIGGSTFGNDANRKYEDGTPVVMRLPILVVPDNIAKIGKDTFWNNDSTVVVGSQSVLSAIGPENGALAKMIYVTGEVTEPVDAIQNCFVAILGGGKVPENPTTTTLAVPDKDGAVFAGWYESADFSGERVASDAAEAGRVYYARWCVDHQWSDWNTTLAPTESTAGSRTHTCSICGTEETEDIAPTGKHTYTSTVTTEPTCAPGVRTYTCSDCGATYTEEIAPIADHTWNNGEITTRPTYTSEGERTYTCTVCGATRTEAIDRLTYEPSYPSGGGSSGGTTTRPSTPSTTIPDAPTPLDPGTSDITDQDVPLTGSSFEDVTPGDWFYEAVQYVYGKDLMKGTSDTQFSPYASTQRGMIVTILHRLEGTPAAAASTFADVEAGQWYADAVAWGAANGVVEGYSATEFRPLQNITREQLAAILYRYAQLKGYDVSKRADLSGYTDADKISAYALEAMQWAVAEGLITGKTETTLVPGGEATRAEAAMILMRFCENTASAPAANETQGRWLPDGI